MLMTAKCGVNVSVSNNVAISLKLRGERHACALLSEGVISILGLDEILECEKIKVLEKSVRKYLSKLPKI